MTEGFFQPDLFTFLLELKANNSRDWFQANKKRYESLIVDPALAFISAFDERLETISREFRAIPKRVGGSLFRIYRDTRFAKDKTPYKTHVGIHFRHRLAKSAHAPGFYLHLEPDGVFMGGGMWRPERDALLAIRESIARAPEAWLEIVDDPMFDQQWKLEGERLKRPPRGFDAEHPAIEEIKRKDFIAVTQIDDEAVFEPEFVDHFADLCRTASPLVRHLCDAVGVPF